MNVDTKPLEKVIEVWRELNAERSEVMTQALESFDTAKELQPKVDELNDLELYRLRDIAGEAMQLVDEIKMQAQAVDSATKVKETGEVWVAEIEWQGEEAGDYAGWVSVHATADGAKAMLETRAGEYGLDLADIDNGEDQSGSTYMLAKLPIQE